MITQKRGRGVLHLLCILVCMLLFVTQAFAAGTGSLTLNYGHGNVEFRLYRVAESDGSGGYTPVAPYDEGDYARVNLPDQGSTNAEWLAAAETLSGYVVRDGQTPNASGTVSGGSVRFTGLEAGLYLVLGDSRSSGGYTYTPTPFLVYVGTGAVEANVKSDTEGPGTDPGDDGYDYSVTKTWRGGSDYRTDSVTVELYRDGVLYQEVTLNDGNNWRYNWSANVRHQWTVVEVDVPDGFTVTVDRSGNTFTVTNTYESGEGPGPDDPNEPGNPDNPGTPEEPGGPGEPGTPDQPGTPGEPDEPGSGDPGTPDQPGTDEPGLPQTGQLWWPVLILAVCGGGLIAAGLLRRRESKHNEE